MTIIEAVREFILTCPLVDGQLLRIDFLPEEAATYSVDVTPTEPVVKKYMDGSSVRQFLFTLATRSYYDDYYRQQIDNLAFFERFTDWIEAQDSTGQFPELGEGKRPLRIRVTTSGYLFAPENETARYQIQCSLIYYQKGDRT